MDTAIERLEGGTYGVCEFCREPINPARLQARPTARTYVQHTRAPDRATTCLPAPRRGEPVLAPGARWALCALALQGDEAHRQAVFGFPLSWLTRRP
ncbi:TraR/DksA family transcriptional regulator [Ornithinimicrobium cryptoxanthini]|uniref:TraR/DksA family transcriptional regulator n=1 Tax=Ornithinimicrobium cryptoxanthini TaxID=2934161 RepID=UPI00351C62DB